MTVYNDLHYKCNINTSYIYIYRQGTVQVFGYFKGPQRLLEKVSRMRMKWVFELIKTEKLQFWIKTLNLTKKISIH